MAPELYNSLPVPKERLQESWRGTFFQEHGEIGQRVAALD